MKRSIVTFILMIFLATANYGQGIAPSVNKEWTTQAYVQLSSYLDDLAPSDYPLLSSNDGLFDKAVGSISQSMLQNKDFSFDVRIGQAMSFQAAINQILAKYHNAHASGTDYSMELSHLLGLSIAVSNQVIKVVNEFIPTLDSTSQNYKAQIEGLQMMRNGTATQMDGILTTVADTKNFTDKEREIVAKYLVENGVGILTFTAEDYKVEFTLKLRNHLETESSVEISETLQLLLDRLEQ